ncbi:hypothetical protein UVI_02041690 [Ustilaginoidea virens]|uniref:Ipa protein n=1 Tax=Ustilaginoidea virens TaxID=1159556 RepID=A0A1B5LA45_USTVR|nr:hypothetical protein UVI_02041690 [Ustilaginoidea virens]
MELTSADHLRELYGDLSRKYKTHSAAIARIWRSLDGPQRAKCFKAGAAGGVVLQHSADKSLGDVYKFVPEMNLRDVAKPGSDFLLHLLQHRATVPLSEQYCRGVVDGELGDHGFILKMMTEKGLRHAQRFKDSYTLFYDDEEYGNSITIVSGRAESLAALAPGIRAQVVVPQSMGELIITRQTTILQLLNILIEDILEAGADGRSQKPAPKKPAGPASQALPRLTSSTRGQQPKLTVPEVSASAHEQQLCLEDHLELMLTEPRALAHVVNIRFFTQPELVADEKGRRLPVHTDRHISPVLYEAVQDAVRGVSIWSYINLLLQRLQDHPALDKAYRMIVQQELVNAYHIEYARAQGNFKRFVQAHSGRKWFKRISNAPGGKTGAARVALRGNVKGLFGADTQLYYMLRLCQPETGPAQAVEWISKLSDLHRAHPDEQDKLEAAETEALGDLAVVVAFIQDVACAMPLPPLSRKTGQTLTDKLQELDALVARLQAGVDLRDFAVPIDHLLQDGMAAGALAAMDDHLRSSTLGATMRAAYQNMTSECAAELAERHQRARAQMDQSDDAPCPRFPAAAASPPGQAPPRREKEKRRGGGGGGVVVVEAAAVAANPTDASNGLPVGVGADGRAPTPRVPVDAATARVFDAIFRKSEARGPVGWDAFEAAMARLGFSVVPKFGSVVSFLPPSTMSAKRGRGLKAEGGGGGGGGGGDLQRAEGKMVE